MKVVVQNGATHGLSRREIESIVPLLPVSWSRCVKRIVLCQGQTANVEISFHPKEHVLGLYWPVPVDAASKVEGLRELLLALSLAAERGEVPARISAAVRAQHLASSEDLLKRCLSQVVPNAV